MFNKKLASNQRIASATNTHNANDHVSPAKPTTSTSRETASAAVQSTPSPPQEADSSDTTTEPRVSLKTDEFESATLPSLPNNSSPDHAVSKPNQTEDPSKTSTKRRSSISTSGESPEVASTLHDEDGTKEHSPPSPKVNNEDDKTITDSSPRTKPESYVSPSSPDQNTSSASQKHTSTDSSVQEGPSLSLDPGPSDQHSIPAQGTSETSPVQVTKGAQSQDSNGTSPATEATLPTASYQPPQGSPPHGAHDDQQQESRHQGTIGFHESKDATPYEGNSQQHLEASVDHQDSDQQRHPEPGMTPEYAVLERGLQIPTRFSTTALGFRYPPILEHAGISKREFRQFTKELKGLVGLSKTQWLACVCCSCTFTVSGILPSLVLGPAAFSPATVIGYKMAQRKRRRNLGAAQDSGNVEQVVSRWNRTFFKKRGLICRVDLPRQDNDMAEMDLASSALYEYQVRTGEFSSIPGILVTGGNPGD